MSRKIKAPDWDDKALEYITDYTRSVGVPPSIDQIAENVGGLTSKSTIHHHLKQMVDAGLLVQKNKNMYYYPTSIDLGEVSVPKFILEKACEKLLENPENATLVKQLSNYI